MFGLPNKLVAIGAAVLVVLTLFGLYTRWVWNRGADDEKRQQIERSLDRTAKRNSDDTAIRNMDYDGLCRELGGTRWVREHNRCE